VNIYTYKNNGFCNGVNAAYEAALRAKGNRVFTYGEIVHNKRVVASLAEKGVKCVHSLDGLEKGDTLVVRAHGAPKSLFDECEKRGINVIDATCPFVKMIREKAVGYHKQGYKIVIVGNANHPEIIGINGWINNEGFITNGEQSVKVQAEKVLIIFQTTFLKAKIEKSLKNIETDGVKTLEVFKSICYTTMDRQSFVDFAVGISDCVVVVGDRSSSNTNKLLESARSRNVYAVLAEDPADVDMAELSRYKNISVIAGASTPKELTEEVLSKMFASAKDDVNAVVVDNNGTMNSAMTETSESNEFTQAVEKMPKYKPLRAGQKIKGTISHIADDGVSVSFGSKRDGLIPNEEITIEDDYVAAKAAMKVGDSLEVMVLSTDKAVILSKRAVEKIFKDDATIEAVKEGGEFTITAERAVKGGLISKLGSYIIFVPASHIRNGFVKNLDQYVGKPLRLVALDIDLTKKKIIASQKEILNRERKEKEDNFWNNIEVGEIVEGKVVRFASFGAFVNVRGFDCLAHLSDISWNNVKEPGEVLELNKTYEFVVLKLDRETNRVSVGYKQLQPHPWQVAAEKFAVGTVHQGRVARLLPYGAFIELDKGIDGLLHISNVSWDWIADINQVLKVGDMVDVSVLDFDQESKRITLSRKATLEQPVAAAPEKAE